MAGKYVAYVSCYTTTQKDGIKIFDVDEKNGKFISKGEVAIKLLKGKPPFQQNILIH